MTMLTERRPAKKWTKADIKFLCGHIDTFWLAQRPLSDCLFDYEAARAKFEAWIGAHRLDVVLAGVRQFRAMHAERYKQNCETIGNQLVRFTAYGEPDELIERFTKFAREEDAAERKAEAMLQRILAEGLPPEVVAYDTFAKRGR